MKIKKILVSQPKPTTEKSPYFDMSEKYNVKIDFRPFIKVEPVLAKEFRTQRVNIPEYTAIIFKSATPFSIKTYSYFFLLTGLFFGLKSLIFDIIGYVFLTPLSLKMAKESYFNILTILGTALFPILIFLIYIPYNLYQIAESISLFICIGACILVIIKLFQIFLHKIVASFYILLYLCTLEILPLIILYRVYKLIM